MNRLLMVVALCAIPHQAAALSKQDCATLAQVFTAMIPPVTDLYKSLETAEFPKSLELTHEQTQATIQLEASRKEATKALKAYISASQDFAYIMQKCAR